MLEPVLRQLRARTSSWPAARAVHVPLTPGTLPRPTSTRIAAALTPRTRAIIVNTPHNPSATVWSRRRHAAPGRAAARRPTCFVISDEVYEHMVFDGAPHAERGALSRAGGAQLRRLELRQDLPRHRLEGRLRRRAGGAEAEFRKVHQFNVFTVNTPMQHGTRRLHGRPGALPRAAGVLPAQARPLPRRPGATRGCALLPSAGQLLPVRRLLGGQRPSRGRLLPLADDARSASPRSRCRRSTPTASSSASRASASPRRTRRWHLALERLAAL